MFVTAWYTFCHPASVSTLTYKPTHTHPHSVRLAATLLSAPTSHAGTLEKLLIREEPLKFWKSIIGKWLKAINCRTTSATQRGESCHQNRLPTKCSSMYPCACVWVCSINVVHSCRPCLFPFQCRYFLDFALTSANIFRFGFFFFATTFTIFEGGKRVFCPTTVGGRGAWRRRWWFNALIYILYIHIYKYEWCVCADIRGDCCCAPVVAAFKCLLYTCTMPLLLLLLLLLRGLFALPLVVSSFHFFHGSAWLWPLSTCNKRLPTRRTRVVL